MSEFLEGFRAKQLLREASADALPAREEILPKQPLARAPPRPVPTVAELRIEFWNAPLEALLDRPTTAAGMGYSVPWLELRATAGGGPEYLKIGRRVRYRKRDVLRWLEQHSIRATSTSCYLSAQIEKSAAAQEPAP